ncbi:uncharacterized protein [Oryza sativa Japonica Group]|uniref:uncharacterized protein isoform X2 n=1 Tax=Oryza sativa subsp. japonica TaxID=39947 RepID=UPI0001C7E1E5|nr:uncharacterized protein LOC4336792 isoform X2 [Oryza sativa Japonica Group]KAF2935553.1 hypothetical protein DAI22_04g239600 [Oryza sativa Japonica Group]
MLAAAAALRPPFRRARLSTSHGGGGGVTHPLRPRLQRRALACRADLQQDAPFAAAIGACLLASLVLPTSRGRRDDDEEEGEFGATDTRMGVMGIISLLPYFNWLSWIFAWLDSGKRRYLFYAAAYLAPYLRTNLSLSPEESWLPIASIFACILHVQLEASIRTGDIETFRAAVTGEFHQHMNLEKSFVIQISSKGDLMSPTTRNKTNQIGTELKQCRPFSCQAV